MTAGDLLHAARGGLWCLLAATGGASLAAGRAVPGPQGAEACPAIRVQAGDGDLHTLLQKAAEAGGFTLHYRAPPRRVSGFEGSFTAAEFIGRLGREAGLVVQYRQVQGCAEGASIARLWVLPTQYPAGPEPTPTVPAAAAASRPGAAEEAAREQRKREDAENAIYVNQN